MNKYKVKVTLANKTFEIPVQAQNSIQAENKVRDTFFVVECKKVEDKTVENIKQILNIK